MKKVFLSEETKRMIKFYHKMFKKSQLKTREMRKTSNVACRIHNESKTLHRVILKLHDLIQRDNKGIIINIESDILANTRRLTPKQIEVVFVENRQKELIAC